MAEYWPSYRPYWFSVHCGVNDAFAGALFPMIVYPVLEAFPSKYCCASERILFLSASVALRKWNTFPTTYSVSISSSQRRKNALTFVTTSSPEPPRL